MFSQDMAEARLNGGTGDTLGSCEDDLGCHKTRTP